MLSSCHEGGPGHATPSDASDATGACPCDAGCVDLNADPNNCGACGARCNAREYCNGAGVCECRPGLVKCGSNCVDVNADVSHCGSCGRPCSPSFWCLDKECLYGGTAGPCPGRRNCDLSCVSPDNDPLNCGGCGVACAVDELCVGGGCKTYAPAFGCTACPCSACASSTACCPPIGTQATPICVAGTICPS